MSEESKFVPLTAQFYRAKLQRDFCVAGSWLLVVSLGGLWWVNVITLLTWMNSRANLIPQCLFQRTMAQLLHLSSTPSHSETHPHPGYFFPAGNCRNFSRNQVVNFKTAEWQKFLFRADDRFCLWIQYIRLHCCTREEHLNFIEAIH